MDRHSFLVALGSGVQIGEDHRHLKGHQVQRTPKDCQVVDDILTQLNGKILLTTVEACFDKVLAQPYDIFRRPSLVGRMGGPE